MKAVRVTIWNEFVHEKSSPEVIKHYPEGIHVTLARALQQQDGFTCRTATLEQPEHGLTEAVLADTDVLVWWGHCAHGKVADAVVDRVQQRVLAGMGLIVLHSGHYSKIFKRLMGTNCSLRWREANEKGRLWNVAPGHPITEGIGPYVDIPHTEMYGERFDIPEPDQLIFISWFEGGDVFRGGCCWRRGNGRIFYLEPGHETYPIYHQPEIQRILANACRWARQRVNQPTDQAPNATALEPIKARG